MGWLHTQFSCERTFTNDRDISHVTIYLQAGNACLSKVRNFVSKMDIGLPESHFDSAINNGLWSLCKQTTRFPSNLFNAK